MSNRAEQFLAFDALKGLKEALREKEKVRVDKKDLSEEDMIRINQVLCNLKKNMLVKVVYYSDGEYLQIEGMVSKIEPVYKKLIIVKEEIHFNDILDIRVVDFE